MRKFIVVIILIFMCVGSGQAEEKMYKCNEDEKITAVENITGMFSLGHIGSKIRIDPDKISVKTFVPDDFRIKAKDDPMYLDAYMAAIYLVCDEAKRRLHAKDKYGVVVSSQFSTITTTVGLCVKASKNSSNDEIVAKAFKITK